MLATIGIILMVLAVLMFIGLLVIDSQSLMALLIYGFTVIVQYWIQIAVVLFGGGLLILLFNFLR